MGEREFSGEPETRWLTESGSDRKMAMLKGFWFKDRAGKPWEAPAGVKIDGATIPKALWSIIGSPYTGEYRRASIVHDVASEKAKTVADRRAADRMFFEACREGGCEWWEAAVLYIGVRIGAWAKANGLDHDQIRYSERMVDVRQQMADERMKALLNQAADLVLGQGETDDPFVIEKRTDEAFNLVAPGVKELAYPSSG